MKIATKIKNRIGKYVAEMITATTRHKTNIDKMKFQIIVVSPISQIICMKGKQL